MPLADGATPQRVAGDYDLLRRLGSGAMGEVWLGRHTKTRGISAVKVLHPTVARSARVQRFFARERRAVARLQHPHIVALHALGAGFIATAYVEGADLARRMQTPIEPRVALHYALQIASALAHAHAQGVVHRDVKPSNILVDHRGNAFLTDFGLAAILDEDDASAAENRAGTPAYMAPEQARGGAEVGPAADQFALARTLAVVLAGVSVADGEDPFAHLSSTIPGPLVDTLRRATAPEPSARFPSIEAFAAALAAIPLGDATAPMRLAPELRVRAPFGWCAGASAAPRTVTPDIHTVDYRLSDLERAGLLPREAVEAFRGITGYEDVGWTMYGHQGRLGPLATDGALARASDLVVILHGMFCTRVDWHDLATALCRDNAQAIVLVPDLFGCGESRLAERSEMPPEMKLEGHMAVVTRWLELLSLRDLPTVLVGHSISGSALLSVTDESLGERVSRIAITPSIPGAAVTSFRLGIGMAKLVAYVPAVRRLFAKLQMRSSEFQRFGPEAGERLFREFMRTPPWLMMVFATEYVRARPVPAASLRRCAILLGEDDPVSPAAKTAALLIEHGFPAELIERLAESGHYPTAHQAGLPESKARNLADIARCVDSMLSSSREGTPMSTLMASTVLGEDASVTPACG